MIRSRHFRRALLCGASCLLLQPTLARADFLLQSFIVPDASLNAARFTWDVMYNPYNGQNFPDFRGAGTKQTSASPMAYLDPANPTITQTGDSKAFIVGPGSTGNIYSFSGPTAYRVDGSTNNYHPITTGENAGTYSTPYNLGTLSFQYQTAGTLIDYNTIRLQYTDAGGTHSLLPTELLREHSGSTGSAFGGLTNRTAAQWDLSGLNIRTYQITYNAAGSSNSFQIATLATSATSGDIVPASRVWSTGGLGNWSNGFSNRQGNTGLSANTNGNVRFTNTATAATVLDGNYTVGEVRFTTPASASINSPGGFTLTTNTGITTTAAATGTYTVGANIAFGAFNLFEVNGGQVVLNGTLSGTEGFDKSGAGTLTVNGNVTATGGISVSEGTLRVNGTLGGGGNLDLASGAVLAGAGTINRVFTVAAGARISPGNSVGMLGTVAQTWEGGGIYHFELNTVANDRVQITGGLSLTASAAAPFKLELRTLTLAGAEGALESFDQTTAHTWQIATASGGVTGFDANGFQVDATGFANAFNGRFAVTSDGTSVFLTYAPVPEPGTVCWLVGAGCVMAAAYRRRKHPVMLADR